MRLQPIDRPPTLMARIAYALCKRRLGKVITPFKVAYARVPESFRLAYEMAKLQEKLSLDDELAFLVRTHVAQINSCSFCIDISKAVAIGKGMTLDKCRALSGYATSPLFSDRERAALAYVEEANRSRTVRDETFDALRPHFDERQIVELTMLCAIENFYNRLNLPLDIESDELCSLAQSPRAEEVRDPEAQSKLAS